MIRTPHCLDYFKPKPAAQLVALPATDRSPRRKYPPLHHQREKKTIGRHAPAKEAPPTNIGYATRPKYVLARVAGEITVDYHEKNYDKGRKHP
jgi:hypothetical protein